MPTVGRSNPHDGGTNDVHVAHHLLLRHGFDSPIRGEKRPGLPRVLRHLPTAHAGGFQMRPNHPEHPVSCAAVALHERLSFRSRGMAQVRIREVGDDGAAESGRTADDFRAARLNQPAADLGEVEHVRPEQHRQSERGGLEHVVPAPLDQRTAHVGDGFQRAGRIDASAFDREAVQAVADIRGGARRAGLRRASPPGRGRRLSSSGNSPSTTPAVRYALAGRPVELTLTEYELLRVLSRSTPAGS